MSLLFALSLPLDRRVRAFLARAILTESGKASEAAKTELKSNVSIFLIRSFALP